MIDTIFEIGTYDSGMDSGEIGYSLRPYNLEKLSNEDLKRVVRMMDNHYCGFQDEYKKRGLKFLIYTKGIKK